MDMDVFHNYISVLHLIKYRLNWQSLTENIICKHFKGYYMY